MYETANLTCFASPKLFFRVQAKTCVSKMSPHERESEMEHDNELIGKIREQFEAKLDTHSLIPLVYMLHGTRVLGQRNDDRSVYAVIGADNTLRFQVFESDQAARDALGRPARQVREKLESVFRMSPTEDDLEDLLEAFSTGGPIKDINFKFGDE